MNKLISIVIPTLNRANYISYTLYAYKDQVIRNLDKIELIVCDNASNDNTISVIENINSKIPFFKIKKFSEQVIAGESIKRAISQAKSKYVLMWGDDDLPSPFMVDTLLYYIDKYPEAGLFHLNRLFGYDNIDSIQYLTVQKPDYSTDIILYNDLNEFINHYFLDMTFLSSMMFQNVIWKEYSHVDSSKHYGYEFLFPIFLGLKNRLCVYVGYPMCIQRQPLNRIWLDKSPLYRFLGMPNLIFDMQKNNLLNNAKQLWMNTGNSTKYFWSVAPQISLYKKKYYSLCSEINRYQYSFIRKIFIYVFAYIFPSYLYKIVRKVYFSKKNSTQK